MSDWKTRAEKELRGRPLDDLTWRTAEGIDVAPVHTPEDAQGERLRFSISLIWS